MVKTKLKIYLAHAYSNMKKIRDIELKLLKKHLNTVNPFYDIEIKYDKKNYKEIVMNDIYSITQCDAVLVYLDKVATYGTIMEMVYAKAFNKPIYLICLDNKILDNPWIKYHNTKVYVNFNEFIKYEVKQK